ncbi:2-phospho-L-lactate guanylyltransferase [Nocardioides sp. AE5]|uniref:2-phospho-L-lactate guanylyltransferase n=1 Tax=Nocardioides sp. AE5 TaxID=2962573 RepID=UPI002881438E|nr:2-phospho-L-lactate guanylyltransferase [Nocardioides sp. AE5]MDT0202894.1 2-phospho-L-lactate guanylyltransferase [Nocardioides sp. AE5]
MSGLAPFTVLVPVKPPAVGKSRLGQLPDEQRIALATAFAHDTLSAALAAKRVAQVLVVTDDFRFAAVARELGCAVLPDGVQGDLNGSLAQAAHEAVRRWPKTPVAALCADLPALRPEELDEALGQVPGDRPAFVADALGTGTTMYAAPRMELFDPMYGVDSAARHAEAGAMPVQGTLASLRQDVDEPGDLGRAMVLGVGTHTAGSV